MLSPTIQEALNKQINHEFYSSYFYLSVSAYFESHNLGGFAHWMRLQSQEERARNEVVGPSPRQKWTCDP